MPRAYWVLAVAVAATSTSAIFARLAHAPSLMIAFSRCFIACAALAPFALLRLRNEATKSAIHLTIWSGILLAIHFATWIASLELTSVASSVVLVCSSPLFVSLAAPKVTGDKLHPSALIGLVLALAGTMVIGAGDFRLAGSALLGDLLALVGAIAAAGYILIGRLARRTLSLPSYAFCTYGIAGIIVFAVALLTNVQLRGFPAETYGWILAIGLVPQLIGHSSYNWALGQLSAPIVSTALLLEPIGASLLAWLVLGEMPTLFTSLGGVLILLGVAYALWKERAD